MASLKLVFVAFLACWLASSIYGVQLIRAGNLSCNEKQQILNQHNKLRQSVALGQVRGQPPAANMRELVWDEELASIAQNWANRGVIQHNTPRSGRFPVGENIAATWTFQNPSPSGSTPDFNKVINDWFVESSAFPGSGVSSYHFDRTTGHYTQIAWATTTYLGCGYSYYYDTQKGYTKFYVCNYGPAEHNWRKDL
ncbi:hypothetical protein J437_LFUL015501 [Ladona fulva]|uniref:SCP domain-containing protein n=1 Tax=Ladona fulva TaxID=123851 RepID=A0A8K0KIE9_LADFU|nr:hypothetical protein J437_LFUL015501 [Ladona fulva]